jgi:hypothetical protein
MTLVKTTHKKPTVVKTPQATNKSQQSPTWTKTLRLSSRATKTEKDKLEGELKSLRAQMILDRQSGRKTEDGQPEVDENGKTEFENFMANPSGYMNQMLEQREMVVEYKQTVKQTTDELHQWATDNNRERELDEAQKFFADPSFAWPSGTSIPERARLIMPMV